MGLSYGSGLTDGRPLLWWHPMVWFFILIIAGSTILVKIGETIKELYKQCITDNYWRTKL